MTDISIRTAEMEDAPMLADLMTQLGYRTAEDEMTKRMADILSKDHYFTFVAEKQGTVVGMVNGYIGPYVEKNTLFARILAMVVDKAHRGRRIGAALLGAVEVYLKENGVAELLVNTRFERYSAHRFYDQHGFRKTGFRFMKPIENT